MLQSLKPLYQKAKNGKIKIWIVSFGDQYNRIAILKKEYGYIDGQKQENIKFIKGKNIGKANETTPKQQAELVAWSDWNKKKDQGYTTNPSGESNVKRPMEAQPFKDNKHKVLYPAFVQTKLNGVRCLATKIAEEVIKFESKNGKSYNTVCAHLAHDVNLLLDIGDILDGELYIHGYTFQEIIRLVKKYRPGETEKLEFHAFDIAYPEYPNSNFDHRWSYLRNCYRHYIPDSLNIFLVKTYHIYREAEVYTANTHFVNLGYEGTIIRNLKEGAYEFGHRSAHLQKYKEFIDSEFRIVSSYLGDDNLIIFEVVTPDNAPFGVRPKGSVEYKQRLWKNRKDIHGKLLTVRYQELSEDGIPIFPVGIAIRDYE